MNPSGLKKFLTEDEVAEKKRITQELWEKVRNADDPIIKPEEEYNPKSLYERLQEEREKSDLEYAEQKKYKNQIRGLQKDESDFLSRVFDIREHLEEKIQREDEAELASFREAVDAYASTAKDLEDSTPRQVEPANVPMSNVHKSSPTVSRQKRAITSAIVKRKLEAARAPTGQAQDPGANQGSQQLAAQAISQTHADRGPRIAFYPSAIVTPALVLPSLKALQQYSEDDGEEEPESEIDEAQRRKLATPRPNPKCAKGPNGRHPVQESPHPKGRRPAHAPDSKSQDSSTTDSSSSSAEDDLLDTLATNSRKRKILKE